MAFIEEILPKIKDRANIINLDDYESIKTHLIAVYLNGDNATYYDSFGDIFQRLYDIFQKYCNKYL